MNANLSNLSTPFGPMVVTASDVAVLSVRWREAAAPGKPPRNTLLERALNALGAYFRGERPDLSLLPLATAELSPFARDVLATTRAVPYGDTATYGALAAAVGRPRAARAVGSVMRANPFAIVVPCHRVVPATGGIGDYSGPTGAKRFLLALEGAAEAGRAV